MPAVLKTKITKNHTSCLFPADLHNAMPFQIVSHITMRIIKTQTRVGIAKNGVAIASEDYLFV